MSVKNNKVAGIDNAKAKLLKIGPEIFCEEIAQIFTPGPALIYYIK